MKFGILPIAAAALTLAGCGGGSAASPGPPVAIGPQSRTFVPRGGERGPSSGKIQHVVIIVQENRSLNNLFYGFPGARTVRYGYDSHNKRVKIAPIQFETHWDVGHGSKDFFQACNGTGRIPGTDCRMNGFDKEYAGCGPCPVPHPQYAYVPGSETKPYFDMGKQYVLADEMFASNFDGSSFVSHQYIIAGQSESSVDWPFSAWGCPGGPSDKVAIVGPQRQVPDGFEVACWDTTTLGDELDKAGLSWGFYTSQWDVDGGVWSAYQAINHIYNGPDWGKDVITPQTDFLDDVSKGKLRAVSWITPTCANSDHAGCFSNTGPSWVAQLVNAVGESQYWDSTAIFVFWDDYGGWYDPQPPKYLDYDGLGIRIPMLILSAYAKKGHVSHVHYEHGSILKFVEDTFGLARLSASDSRANSVKDAFDFSKPPRAFVPIQSPYDRAYFMHQPVDLRAPDPE
ncbi:MAG TPA: alkaline phosphatase family protein [Candidatus Binatia bacterium]|nr:alkaline phosphatase family protein [Candidatus Binatia bacterium]